MAKSTSGTKKINEALTPDQVSKVEDKYKSIYSGMLKGNKKKLMKYIDPKLKRPNPDAMAMGRAINLVKKETETETINEGLPPGYGKFLVSLQMLITDIAPNAWGNKSQIRRGDVKRIHNSLKKRYGGEYEKFNNLLKTQSGPLGDWYLQETVNENESIKLGVKYQLPTGETGYIMTGGSDDPRDWKFSGNKQPYLSVEDKLTPLENQPGKYDGAFDMGRGKGHHIDEELVNEDNSYDSFKTDASERFLNRSQVVELLPVLKNSLNKLNFSPSKQPTLSVKRYGLSSSNKGYVISMYIPTSKDDIIVELGKYPKDDKTDEVSISLYLPNEEGRLTQVAYETSTSPKGEELAEDSNILSKVISMANQWYEKPTTMVKEEAGMPPPPNANTGDLFSSLEATGKLEAPQGGASMVGQNYTLNGDSKYDKMFFSYEPNSPTPFGLKQIGGHGLDSRFLSKFGLKPTQSWTAGVDQFIFDGNYNPRWFDEKRFGEIVDHFSGGLSREAKRQRDFYKDRGQTSGTIDERLATLVKEVYSEKQRKWACSQDGPEFDEMCKDTAISKKKLEEGIDFVKVASYFGMSYPEFYSKSPKVRKEMVERYKKDNTSLKEERTSTVSKARAKSELKQMLKGKRDDGMGKSTLKAVLAIDKDGKETKVKKLEDFDKFEKGTKFSLKETTMNNDRLTELIKAALTGPVKEDNFHSPRTVKNIPIGDEDKDLTTVDLDWYEKKDKERREKAGADMRKNQNSLKEGVWSMGTVTEINRFIKDIKEMKNHYYDIVGSDDVFDGLDRAERAAEELAMNAPENRGDFDGDALTERILKKLRG